MSQPNGAQPSTAPQPEPRFVIAALQEELATANANRLYLLSLIKQLQAEYGEAQQLWALERDSLKTGEPLKTED